MQSGNVQDVVGSCVRNILDMLLGLGRADHDFQFHDSHIHDTITEKKGGAFWWRGSSKPVPGAIITLFFRG